MKSFFFVCKVKSDKSNKKDRKIFQMFRPNKFQRSILPLIIANSIVCTGLLEYFVSRTIRTIGFVYIICCLIYYINLFYTFANMLDTLKVFQPTDLAKIISAITFIENPLIYVTTIFIGFLRRKVQCLLLIK